MTTSHYHCSANTTVCTVTYGKNERRGIPFTTINSQRSLRRQKR